MKNIKMKKFRNTDAANRVLWGSGTPEQRWQEKANNIIIFIARLGWSTVELVNFYLCQSKRDWVKKMQEEGSIVSKKGIIDDRVATILVLTKRAQSRAKKIDSRIGRRIDKEVTRQSRHDFIAAWIAVWLINSRTDLRMKNDNIEIWADRVLRGFIRDETIRPDVSIMWKGKPVINIEIERTRKTSAEENYKFLSKLRSYQDANIEVITIFERKSQAVKFVDGLKLAENFGLNRWYRNAETKKWYEIKSEAREIFRLYVLVGIWNHARKEMEEAIFHNYEEPEFYE